MASNRFLNSGAGFGLQLELFETPREFLKREHSRLLVEQILEYDKFFTFLQRLPGAIVDFSREDLKLLRRTAR